jgi:hypothetical protein
MAKKKEPAKKPARTGRSTQLYMKQELADALTAYIEATRPRPTITAVLEMALENLLRDAGFYPPK